MRVPIRASIPLAAALGAIAVLVPSGDLAAFELATTKGGHELRWETDAIELVLDPSFIGSAYGAADAARDAARAWSGVAGAPEIRVTNGAGGDEIGAIGRNVVFFVPGGYPKANGALAVTVVTFDANGRIVDADIVVSGAYRFGVLDAAARSTDERAAQADAPGPLATSAALAFDENDRFDLVHVLAHETGHLLGLADAKGDSTAVMFRTTAPNDASRRAPNADDLGGIRALYTPASHGCAGASVSPVPPAPGVPLGSVALLVAGALVLAARSQRVRSGRGPASVAAR